MLHLANSIIWNIPGLLSQSNYILHWLYIYSYSWSSSQVKFASFVVHSLLTNRLQLYGSSKLWTLTTNTNLGVVKTLTHVHVTTINFVTLRTFPRIRQKESLARFFTWHKTPFEYRIYDSIVCSNDVFCNYWM